MFIVLDLSKRNIIIAVLIILFSLSLGSLTGYLTYDFLRTDIVDGVYLQDLALGKLSKNEATKKIREHLQPRLKEPIRFKVEGQTYTFTAESLGVGFDFKAIADKAYQVGRQGSWWQQRTARQRILKNGLQIAPVFTWNESSLKMALKELASQTEKAPVPARWEVMANKKEVKLVPAIPGREIDYPALITLLEEELAHEPPYELKVPYRSVKPRLDTEEAANLGIQEVISSYRTYFNPENTGRVKNISLAAEAIDGKILLPGETFSFNRSVGPRIPESGYQEAPIIVNGKLVPGIGGGVCQVSTTLYNAAVLADLSILERNRHSLPSAYIGPGRDATVFYDYLDLKLHNPNSQPVVIDSRVGDNYVEVRILGQWLFDWQVQIRVEEIASIEPQWTEIPDPSLDEGERLIIKEAMPGKKVRVWKEYIGPQGLISREVLSVDTYQPINGEVRVPVSS